MFIWVKIETSQPVTIHVKDKLDLIEGVPP